MLSLMSLRKRVTDFMVGNVGSLWYSYYKVDNDSRALVMSAL
jgi:hypothetical protein